MATTRVLRPILQRVSQSYGIAVRAASTSSSSMSSSSSSERSAKKGKGDQASKSKRNIVLIKQSGSATFKEFLPITPSIRQLRQPLSPHLHKGKPVRALTIAKRGTGGRNNTGRITVRARGGGHKRRIRLVDFVRLESGEQDVVRIEYDPGRSAHIALLQHKETQAVSYILAPEGLRAGDTVSSYRSGLPAAFMTSAASTTSAQVQPASATSSSSSIRPDDPQTVVPPETPPSDSQSADVLSESSSSTTSPVRSSRRQQQQHQQGPDIAPSIDLGMLRSLALKPGNLLPIRYIPVGTVVHAITLNRNGPAVLARSAGSSARIMSASSPNGKNAQIRLSSGEVRYVGLDGFAAIGSVSNPDHQHENLGKAGRMRWLGFRPQSRGVAMNSRDHPMGGGRGKSKGNRVPRDKWNNSADGGRTRSPKSKNGNKMVVKERPRGTEKAARR